MMQEGWWWSVKAVLVSSLGVVCQAQNAHEAAHEAAWFEDLSFCIGSRGERLTKPLKLMDFSCASRDVRLISLLSSRAGAVQLPDNDKRREPQASALSVVCSFIPSQLPINDGWGEQRQRAKHVQPMHTIQSCIIQAVLFPVCAGGTSQKLALLLLEGASPVLSAGAGAGSFWKSTSQMQMLSFIKTHLKPSVINKHKTLSQLGHAVDYGSPLFFISLA